jgi:hypothetical protein
MSIQDSGMWLLFPEVYSSLVSGPVLDLELRRCDSRGTFCTA